MNSFTMVPVSLKETSRKETVTVTQLWGLISYSKKLYWLLFANRKNMRKLRKLLFVSSFDWMHYQVLRAYYGWAICNIGRKKIEIEIKENIKHQSKKDDTKITICRVDVFSTIYYHAFFMSLRKPSFLLFQDQSYQENCILLPYFFRIYVN